MRVLFLNGRFPQYSQTFVHDQVRAAKRDARISQVIVAATSKSPERFEQSEPECAGALVASRPISARQVLGAAASLATRPLAMARLLSAWRRGALSSQALGLLMQLPERVDRIVVNFGSNLGVALQMKAAAFPQAPCYAIIHGHDITSYVGRNGWCDYDAAVASGVRFITVNNLWRDRLRARYPDARVATHYMGAAAPEAARLAPRATGRRELLFVGRLVEKKGLDDLLNALALLRDQGADGFHLHVCGDGDLATAHRALVGRLRLRDAVAFYGAQPPSVVHDLMTRCDLLVLPSRTAQSGDSEGVPLVLMEAMHRRLPVLATRHSGIPELIRHGETGHLTPEGDPAALAAALRRFDEAPEVFQAYARRAFHHAAEHHDQDRQSARLIDRIVEEGERP